MKTINFILVITLFSFFTTNAQITKGNWMVGGNGSFQILKVIIIIIRMTKGKLANSILKLMLGISL